MVQPGPSISIESTIPWARGGACGRNICAPRIKPEAATTMTVASRAAFARSRRGTASTPPGQHDKDSQHGQSKRNPHRNPEPEVPERACDGERGGAGQRRVRVSLIVRVGQLGGNRGVEPPRHPGPRTETNDDLLVSAEGDFGEVPFKSVAVSPALVRSDLVHVHLRGEGHHESSGRQPPPESFGA